MTKQEIITEFEKKFIHTTDDGIKTIHCGGSIIDDINLFLFQALTEFEQTVREEITNECVEEAGKLVKINIKERWHWLNKLAPFSIHYYCDEDCSYAGCPGHSIRFELHSVSDQISIYFYDDSDEHVTLDQNKVHALLKGIKKYNPEFFNEVNL